MKNTAAILGCLMVLAAGAEAQEGSVMPRVELETSKGVLILELDQDKAPATVASFLDNVRSGFYEGTIFHRVIPGFMIQGGGLTESLQLKPTEKKSAERSGQRTEERAGHGGHGAQGRSAQRLGTVFRQLG